MIYFIYFIPAKYSSAFLLSLFSCCFGKCLFFGYLYLIICKVLIFKKPQVIDLYFSTVNVGSEVSERAKLTKDIGAQC